MEFDYVVCVYEYVLIVVLSVDGMVGIAEGGFNWGWGQRGFYVQQK